MSEFIKELYYIVAIENIPSVLRHGILSYDMAMRLRHVSVANREVQGRRANKKVPNGLSLHSYVNLYVNARNPMLYTLMCNGSDDICILKLENRLIEFPGVVITDGNAASDWVSFYSLSEAMDKLDLDMIYARYWTHEDPHEQRRHKSIMCAEVLVPNIVAAVHINGAYVSCSTSKKCLSEVGFDREIIIDGDMFFNRQVRGRS